MFETVRLSWRLLKSGDKYRILGFTAFRIATNFLDVFALLLIGVVGTMISGSIGSGQFQLWASQVLGDYVVAGLLLVVSLVFILKSGMALVLAKLSFAFLARLEVAASHKILENIFFSNLSRMRQHSESNAQFVTHTSTNIAFSAVLGHAMNIASDLSLLLLIFSYFIYSDWVSALAVLGYFSAVMAVLNLVSRNQMKAVGQSQAHASLRFVTNLQDFFRAFREIRVLGKENVFIRRVIDSRTRLAEASARENFLLAIPRVVAELSLIFGVIAFASWHISASGLEASLELIGVFVFGSLRSISAMLPLQRSLMQLSQLTPLAARSQEIISTLNRDNVPMSTGIHNTSSQRAEKSSASKGFEVIMRSVDFEFDDTAPPTKVLSGVSLEIAPCQHAAIIGPSGSGKSTIVSLLLGLDSPNKGHVAVNKKDPRLLVTSAPGSVGYVPQKPGLVSGTILENIALGIPTQLIDFEQIHAAVEMAQLEPLIKSLPLGLNSNLGAQADSLSGGQLQRIGIARAIYSKPSLLVLDEATASLDVSTESSITSTLEGLKSEMTLVVVAHRLSTIKRADVVFFLQEGKIRSSGTLQELSMNTPEVKKYLSLMNFESPSS